MKEAVRFIVRAELHTRARAYVGVAIVVLLSAGVAMASLAGARRTASAFDRYLASSDASDLAINVSFMDDETQAALEALPGVTSVQTYAGAVFAPFDAETFEPEFPVVNYEGVVSLDGRFLVQDRAAVESGRLPDPEAADEVMINRVLADLTGYEVGDRLALGLLDPTTFEFIGEADVTITGITVTAEEVAVADIDSFSRVTISPALLAEHPGLLAPPGDQGFTANYWWSGLRLEPGVDPASVEAAWESSDAAAEGSQTNYRYRRTSTIQESVARANRPQVVALASFGVIAAALALLLTALAVRRSVRAGATDANVLRAIGADPRTATAGPAIASGLAVVVGALGAVVVATLLSPLAPLGPVRAVEPRDGAVADAVVLVPGVAALVAVAVGTAAVVGRRVRNPSGTGTALAPTPPLPLVPSLGVHFALGRGSAAARTAVVGAVIATVAVVATLAFGQSLEHLERTSRLFGADFDVALQIGAGYSQFDHEAMAEYLDEEFGDVLVAHASATNGVVSIDGSVVPAIGIDIGSGEIGPALRSGRAPAAVDEIALGQDTMEALGVDEGDSVDLDGHELTVVGTVVLPALGQALGDHPSLGTGAWLTGDGLRALELQDGDDGGASAVLLRLAPGADVRSLPPAMEREPERWGLSEEDTDEGAAGLVQVLQPPRPAELVGASGSGSASLALSASLFAGALVALAFALAASVRLRRRDLGVLKAIGCTRWQVLGMIETQALVTMFLGAVVGVPVGIALGSILWRLFAEDLGVLEEAVVPLGLVAAAGLVGTVVAGVLAAMPARAAARLPAALALRAE